MKRNNSNFDKKKFIIENNIYLDFPIMWEKRDLCVVLSIPYYFIYLFIKSFSVGLLQNRQFIYR